MTLAHILQGLDGNRKRLGPHPPPGQQGTGVPRCRAGSPVQVSNRGRTASNLHPVG